jgi:xylulokinase
VRRSDCDTRVSRASKPGGERGNGCGRGAEGRCVGLHRGPGPLAIEEGAAYGAALLGHVAGGTFADVDEATALVRILDDVTEPHPHRTQVYEDSYAVYRSLYATLRGDMHRLAELGS